jgi:selenocysteine-specific elongation factor
MALVAQGALAPSEWLTISVRALESAPPLRNGRQLRALVGAAEIDARLRLLDRDVLQPGEEGLAQLRLDEPTPAPAREHLILRLASPAQTVAGGRVLEPEARRERRNSPPILQRLWDLRDLPPPALVAAEVARAGATGTTVRRLSRLSALAEPRVLELLPAETVVVTRSGLVVPKPVMERLLAEIPAHLGAHPEGLAPDKLMAALLGTSAVVLDAAIGRLLARGVIRRHGGQLVVPRPDEELARARDEGELAARLAEILRRGGLAPPDPKELVADLTSKRAVDRLVRNGVAVRAVDRAKGKEILFHREAIEEAQRRLEPLLNPPGLLVTEIGAALGVSRKYSLPLLDHLDTIRFTRRMGDRRVRGPLATRAAS